MSTDGVEVAQDDALDGCTRVNEVLNNLLVNLLRVAIGRKSLLDGSLLGDGQILLCGLTIYCTARREDDTLHVILWHEFQKVNERDDVVAIVQQRLLHTLANGLRSSEVDDTLNLRILLEHSLRSIKVAKVNLLESRTYARNLLDAVEHLDT